MDNVVPKTCFDILKICSFHERHSIKAGTIARALDVDRNDYFKSCLEFIAGGGCINRDISGNYWITKRGLNMWKKYSSKTND